MTNSKPNWKIRKENEVSCIMAPRQLPSRSGARPDTFTYPGAAGAGVWAFCLHSESLCTSAPISPLRVSVGHGA